MTETPTSAPAAPKADRPMLKVPWRVRLPVLLVMVIVLAVGIGLLTASILLANKAGHLPLYEDKPFSPTDLSGVAVAGATLILAALTGTLAYFTWESVQAGRLAVDSGWHQ